jgi:hypothetical protein
MHRRYKVLQDSRPSGKGACHWPASQPRACPSKSHHRHCTVSPSRTSTQRGRLYQKAIAPLPATRPKRPYYFSHPTPLIRDYLLCIRHTNISPIFPSAHPSPAAAKQLHLQPCPPLQYPKLQLAIRFSVLPSTDQVTCLSVEEEVQVGCLRD